MSLRRVMDKITVGNNGIKLTKGLFREWGPGTASYTMYPEPRELDNKIYPSAYQIYMDSVNEYDAAMKLVGSMDHWNKLCDCTWFMNGITQNGNLICRGLKHWREDRELKREAEALRALEVARDNGNVQAARYLHEMSYKVASGKKNQKKEVTSEDKEVKEMLKRVK